MEVMSILSELIVENKRVRRNFDFFLHRERNSLQEESFIIVRKDYKDANNLSLAKNSSVEISLRLNNSPYSLFKGKIVSTKKAENEYYIFALSNLSLSLSEKVEPQSYVNISFSSLLKKYCYQYQTDYDTVLPHFLVSYESKREVVKRAIDTVNALTRKNIPFFVENNVLKIRPNPKTKIWKIDDYVIRLTKDKLITFPFPEISLGDLVEYNGQVFSILAITMSKRNFCLSIGDKNAV
ncbi:MAG: hypothetical protein HPY78_03350 [Brevinematales bacterium]|nr:hypothetical protein [Brevinematales bacterium]